MKQKTFPLCRSTLFLRRIASAALLMLTFHTAAMAYTVTLNPGEGSGDPIVIDSEVKENMAADMSSAARGQFYMDNGQLWFILPNRPDSFTPPTDKFLNGWTKSPSSQTFDTPGTHYLIVENLVLYAFWGQEIFSPDDPFSAFKYAVTNYSPLECKIIEALASEDVDLIIPGYVEHDGKQYAVTEIADGLCINNDMIRTLSIPATVRYIGDECFYCCFNLTTVSFELRSQLETIGKSAFNNCFALKSVYGLPVKTKFKSPESIFENSPLQNITLQGHGVLRDEIFLFVMRMQSYQWILPSNEYEGFTWTTFYSPISNLQADGATTVYTAELKESSLQLHEVPDRIINKNTPVILKSTGNPVLTKTEAESTDDLPNSLNGADSDNNTLSGTYVLYGGEQGLGFYPYNGEYLQAGKAYVYIPSGSGVKGFVGMTETPSVGTTTIPSMPAQNAQEEATAPWYSIQGLPLPARPTRPGIYIHGGRKVVIP